jgi:uncharacterized membrane protein
MQTEIVDWLFNDGGLVILSLIVAALFVVQAVFTFLLWRKGNETYLLKFIVYAIAAAAILIADFGFALGPLNEVISMDAWIGFSFVFLLMAGVAGGIQIYFFIRDTWVRKEEAKA